MLTLMTDLVALKNANARRWTAAKITRPFTSVAQRLVAPAAKQRYQSVSARTGVPWWFIAIVHEREASQNFDLSLAQGDRWDRISIHVPKGRGPFESWEAAAVDALAFCPPFASKNRDWSSGGAMTMAEEYNGLGYANRGQPSPYVWSGTDQYRCGKYVRDGVYDPNVIDAQLGCAGLLKAMMEIDPSITLVGAPVVVPSPPLVPKPAPVPAPARPSLIASIISFFLSLFRRKP